MIQQPVNYNRAIIIETMLMQEGDSDTNTCIVGGLIGAAVGYSNIPKNYSEEMLNCVPKARPPFLVPCLSRLLKMIDGIFAMSNETVTVLDGMKKK